MKIKTIKLISVFIEALLLLILIDSCGSKKGSADHNSVNKYDEAKILHADSMASFQLTKSSYYIENERLDSAKIYLNDMLVQDQSLGYIITDYDIVSANIRRYLAHIDSAKELIKEIDKYIYYKYSLKDIFLGMDDEEFELLNKNKLNKTYYSNPFLNNDFIKMLYVNRDKRHKYLAEEKRNEQLAEIRRKKEQKEEAEKAVIAKTENRVNYGVALRKAYLDNGLVFDSPRPA